MKRFKKCLSALFLSCFLAFGNVSGCYLEVQAFEWILPTITIEEALPWLLGLLGIYVGSEAGQEVNWGELKENCIEFQENQGNSAVAVSKWWDDILSGSLSQVSECWQSFKDWAKSLKGSSLFPVTVSGVNSIITSMCPNLKASALSELEAYKNFEFDKAIYQYDSANRYIAKIIFLKGYTSESSPSNGSRIEFSGSSDSEFLQFLLSADNTSFNYSGSSVSSSVSINLVDFGNAFFFGCGSLLIASRPTKFFEWDLSSFSNSPLQSLYNDILSDLQLTISTAISDAIPDVVPLPWDLVGDSSEAIQQELDRLYDLVATGVLDISGLMEKIQELLRVNTIDTTADDVLLPERPNPDTNQDETLQDKVDENNGIDGTFVLSGFEKVFPFCIPFDIYAFMTLLVAEPIAPVIRYPIYNPVTKENNEIVLDFSEWESVTVLFRYIFDFLFIIGLLLSARALIGGGDKA